MFFPDSSEPRRVDINPLTTDAPLPVWGRGWRDEKSVWNKLRVHPDFVAPFFPTLAKPSQGWGKDRSLAPSFDRGQQKHASRNRPSSRVNTNFSPPIAMPPGGLCKILIRIQSACLASVSPAEARSMPHSRRVALQALAFLVMISATLPGRADDRPIAEVLRALRPDHPRLYVLDEEIDGIKQQIKSDARLRRWYDRLQKDAEKMLKEPVVVHRLIGPRLLDQSRAALRRISTLAGLYRLDGDHRKADRARQEMLAAAAFPDWNPAHFLDVAEMTNALAIGYDWLYQFLTDADRARIRQAIVEKGLKPGLLIYESGRGWPTVIHNWNQVCNGGLTAGALAVADREPDLARQLIDHARRSIVRAMASFAPDGGWAEGPGYWNYATEYNVFFLSAVESALGTDFGLKQMAGFRETGEFRMQSIGPLNRTFNYADAHDSPGAAPQMFWFAKAFSRPDYAEHESRYIGDRAGIFHLLWAAGLPAALPDSAPPLDKLFRGIDVAFFRSAWNDKDAIFVAFKGGDNRANHSHLDLGTFVLDALGLNQA